MFSSSFSFYFGVSLYLMFAYLWLHLGTTQTSNQILLHKTNIKTHQTNIRTFLAK